MGVKNITNSCSQKWNPMNQHCGSTTGGAPLEKPLDNSMCNYVELAMTRCGWHCWDWGKEFVDIGKPYHVSGNYDLCKRFEAEIGDALRGPESSAGDHPLDQKTQILFDNHAGKFVSFAKTAHPPGESGALNWLRVTYPAQEAMPTRFEKVD